MYILPCRNWNLTIVYQYIRYQSFLVLYNLTVIFYFVSNTFFAIISNLATYFICKEKYFKVFPMHTMVVVINIKLVFTFALTQDALQLEITFILFSFPCPLVFLDGLGKSFSCDIWKFYPGRLSSVTDLFHWTHS